VLFHLADAAEMTHCVLEERRENLIELNMTPSLLQLHTNQVILTLTDSSMAVGYQVKASMFNYDEMMR
jgi:hypothetical protein